MSISLTGLLDLNPPVPSFALQIHFKVPKEPFKSLADPNNRTLRRLCLVFYLQLNRPSFSCYIRLLSLTPGPLHMLLPLIGSLESSCPSFLDDMRFSRTIIAHLLHTHTQQSTTIPTEISCPRFNQIHATMRKRLRTRAPKAMNHSSKMEY